MPVSFSASTISAKRWGSLTKWPLRIDIATLIVAAILLPLAVAGGYMLAWENTFIWEPDDTIYRIEPVDVSLVVFLDVIGPVLAIILAGCNAWFFTSRTLTPSSALSTSIIAMLGWAGVAVSWSPRLGESTPTHLYSAEMGVGIILEIGAVIEILLNFAYLVVSAKAVHYLRKHASARGSPVPSEHELRPQERGGSPTSTIGLRDAGAPVEPAEVV